MASHLAADREEQLGKQTIRHTFLCHEDPNPTSLRRRETLRQLQL